MTFKKLNLSVLLFVAFSLLSLCLVWAGPLTYTERIEKNGKPFNGTASLKFAIVSSNTTLWSHDGTSINSGEPATSLEQEIKDGLFAMTIGRPPMQPFFPELLKMYPDSVLRVWADSGAGFRQFPDRPLTFEEVAILADEAVQQRKRAAVTFKQLTDYEQAGQVPALVRDPKVIEAKIARKKRKKPSDGKRPMNPKERAKQRFLSRAGKDGKIPKNALMRAKAQFDKRRGQFSAADAGIWRWEWLGPGNIGGRVRAILIHPTNPNRMWIGSVSGGIWTTSNGGASWTFVDDFMATLSISSLVMDPTNPDNLYAGTGEGFNNVDALPGAGIFRSTDGGLTWAQIPSTANGNFGFVNRLAHHPSDAGRLFAATRTGVWESVRQGTNPFANWTHHTQVNWNAMDIKIHSTETDRILVGCRNDVYYSDDGGATWTEQTDGSTGKLPNASGRAEVAISESDPDTMYVSMARNGGEIWRTTDGAATWQRRNTGTNYCMTNILGILGNNQCGYDNTIWVDPTNRNLIVVGGIDLWRSIDGGTTLQKISNWQYYHEPELFSGEKSAHADQHAIVHHPGYNGSTNRTVYFGNDGGIQMTSDISTVDELSGWVNLANDLGITQFYGGSAARDGSVIVGGTQDNGHLKYTPSDGTGEWYQWFTGDGGRAAVIDIKDPQFGYNVIWGEAPFLAMYRSITGGAVYLPTTIGLSDANDSNRALFVAPFVADVSSGVETLFAGGASIWRTVTPTLIWSEMRPPIGNNQLCSAIDISRNGQWLWVGYGAQDPAIGEGQVARSIVATCPLGETCVRGTCSITTTQECVQWIRVDNNGTGLPDRWVTDIAINPSDSNEVFVTFGGYVGACSVTTNQECSDAAAACPPGETCVSNSVWHTTDAGNTWENKPGEAPNDLPLVQVNTITFHPVNRDWIYIGTDLGILASEDKGDTWSVTPRYSGNEGPVNVEVSELFWQGDEYLIAATHGRGMFRSRPLDVVFVDLNAPAGGDGSAAKPYKTITQAVNAAGHGTTISIKGGTYHEASPTEPLLLRKRGMINIRSAPVKIVK